MNGRLGRVVMDTRPLAVAPFRRLLIGQESAYLGAMVTQVAVPVQVFDLSRSSFEVGLVGVVGLVPLVVFGLYGGVVADAVDRRLLLLWSSVVSWLVTLLLLTQALLRVESVGLILVLVGVQSGSFAIASSARGAIIPRIVEPELVAAANTLNFTAGNAAAVLGPLLAGLLVTLPSGFAVAYAVDAVLFTAALWSAFRLPPIPPSSAASSLRVGAVAEGLRFVATSPVLLMSFVVDIAAMVLAMPRALFPEAAADRFDGGVGPLYAAIAIGSVAAGLVSGWIGRVRRQGVALSLAVVAWSVAVALSGLTGHLWLAVLLLGVAGAADLVSATFRQTILQTLAPDEMRGRMQGVFIAVVAGGPRLGDLRAGLLASSTTLTVAWSGSAVACGVLVLAGSLAVRSYWTYTRV